MVSSEPVARQAVEALPDAAQLPAVAESSAVAAAATLSARAQLAMASPLPVEWLPAMVLPVALRPSVVVSLLRQAVFQFEARLPVCFGRCGPD
jgi:hypothetical protein